MLWSDVKVNRNERISWVQYIDRTQIGTHRPTFVCFSSTPVRFIILTCPAFNSASLSSTLPRMSQLDSCFAKSPPSSVLLVNSQLDSLPRNLCHHRSNLLSCALASQSHHLRPSAIPGYLYISSGQHPLPMGDDLFFTEIERWRSLFERNPFYAKSDIKKKFKPWDELINEDDMSLNKRPSASRSLRSRKRRKLRAILDSLGAEVLLLCTLATTITRLHFLNEEHLVPRLETWWNSVEHPAALKEVTTSLGDSFPKIFPSQRDHVKVTTVDFKLGDLLSFLEAMSIGDREISCRMTLPWDGQPPFVNIDQGTFRDAGFKVQLSAELGSLWVDYLYRNRRTEGLP